MAWRVPATQIPTPRVTLTNTRIQHADYIAERCTPRYYRILTTPVHTSPVRINPKGPCRPLLASEQHMVSSRGKPPPRSGTADHDLARMRVFPCVHITDSGILVVILGSGSQEPAALRLCALLVHSLV